MGGWGGRDRRCADGARDEGRCQEGEEVEGMRVRSGVRERRRRKEEKSARGGEMRGK